MQTKSMSVTVHEDVSILDYRAPVLQQMVIYDLSTNIQDIWNEE